MWHPASRRLVPLDPRGQPTLRHPAKPRRQQLLRRLTAPGACPRPDESRPKTPESRSLKLHPERDNAGSKGESRRLETPMATVYLVVAVPAPEKAKCFAR